MGGVDIKLYESSTGDYTNPDLGYNIGTSTLKTAISQALAGFDDIQIYKLGNNRYGQTWLISYLNY